jgi:hypothetical protein
MSSEDQFTTIKTLLQALTESQVHAEALAAMRHQETLERNARVDKELAATRESLDRHIEFAAAAITKTAAAQEVTELRLQDLINKVDALADGVGHGIRRALRRHGSWRESAHA